MKTFKQMLIEQYDNLPGIFEVEELGGNAVEVWHKLDKTSTIFFFDENDNLIDHC